MNTEANEGPLCQSLPHWSADRWEAFEDYVSTRWPDLETIELQSLDGRLESLVGLLQTHYGLEQDIATRQLVDLIQEFQIDHPLSVAEAGTKQPGSNPQTAPGKTEETRP